MLPEKRIVSKKNVSLAEGFGYEVLMGKRK
jgi:hypothetical protein